MSLERFAVYFSFKSSSSVGWNMTNFISTSMDSASPFDKNFGDETNSKYSTVDIHILDAWTHDRI